MIISSRGICTRVMENTCLFSICVWLLSKSIHEKRATKLLLETIQQMNSNRSKYFQEVIPFHLDSKWLLRTAYLLSSWCEVGYSTVLLLESWVGDHAILPKRKCDASTDDGHSSRVRRETKHAEVQRFILSSKKLLRVCFTWLLRE